MTREHSIQWILQRTRDLLGKWTQVGDGSFILYAAFECRNMLEMLDFHLLWTGSEDSEQEGLIELAKGKRGIPNSNRQYKILNYKYQEFWAALADLVNFPGEIARYDYKRSGELQEELGEFMHSYTKMNSDFLPNSLYMQEGKSLVNSTIKFIQDFCLHKDHTGKNAIMYGGVKVSSLPPEIRGLYERWRFSSDTGTKAELRLREELSELMKNEPPVNWSEVLGR